VLTRDKRLLFAKVIAHGYCSLGQSFAATCGVIKRLDLANQYAVMPLHGLQWVDRTGREAGGAAFTEPKTRRYYEQFFHCSVCGKVYWEGSHIDQFAALLQLSEIWRLNAIPCAGHHVYKRLRKRWRVSRSNRLNGADRRCSDRDGQIAAPFGLESVTQRSRKLTMSGKIH